MGSGSHFQAAEKVKPTPLLLNRQDLDIPLRGTPRKTKALPLRPQRPRRQRQGAEIGCHLELHYTTVSKVVNQTRTNK
jgi:hypothetical protein